MALRSDIPSLQTALVARADMIVEKTARDIERGCKMRSRVDTGQMRAGWQIEATSQFSRTIFDPVEHTIFNEFGTASRNGGRGMSAQPMLIPSVEAAASNFHKAIEQLFG